MKLQEFVIETEFKSEDSLAVNKSREIKTNISVNTEGKHTKAHSPVETVIGALGSCFMINIQRYFKQRGKEVSNTDVQIVLKGYRDPKIPKLVKIDYEVGINKNLNFDAGELKNFMESSSTTYRTLENSVDVSGNVYELESVN